MNIEDEINSQVWWVLQKIKKKSVLLSQSLFYLKKASPFEIDGQHIGLAPSYATQIEILDSLDGKGAVKVYKGWRAGDLITTGRDEENPEMEVQILKPKFDKIYRQYEKENAHILKAQANKQEPTAIKISGIPKIKMVGLRMPTSAKKIKINVSKLYLNHIGDLWREPKKGNCYPMGEKSGRHQIVRLLATNSGYQQTLTISDKLNGKSQQSIRTEIGKIRNNIKKFLHIPGKQILEDGRKGSGYRINPKFKIIIKDD